MHEIFKRKFQLIGIFKHEPHYNVTAENLGEWTFEYGFGNKPLKTSAVRRQDLQGRVFPAGIVVSNLHFLLSSILV